MRLSASRSGRGASTCFATPARMVARVGFQPTVSWMKARHVGALHQRAMAMVPPPGVEPGTARVRAVCSGQLSYEGMGTAVAVGDEGIGPPLLGRAPVLQTGRGTTRLSPKSRRGCRRRDSNSQVHRLSTCCVYHFRHAGILGPPGGPTRYSRKYSLRGAPSKPTTSQAAPLESGVPTRTGTDRCDPAFRSTPCRRARRAARASRATQTRSHFDACWSAQKDQSGICGLRMVESSIS